MYLDTMRERLKYHEAGGGGGGNKNIKWGGNQGGGWVPLQTMQSHFDKTSNIIPQNLWLPAQIQLPHSWVNYSGFRIF